MVCYAIWSGMYAVISRIVTFPDGFFPENTIRETFPGRTDMEVTIRKRLSGNRLFQTGKPSITMRGNDCKSHPECLPSKYRCCQPAAPPQTAAARNGPTSSKFVLGGKVRGGGFVKFMDSALYRRVGVQLLRRSSRS